MYMAIGSLITRIPSYCNNVKQFCSENTFLIASYWTLSLNTNLFAQKIFAHFPLKIAVWSRAGLNFTGAICLKGAAKELKKVCYDFLMFYEKRNALGMLLTANKIVHQTIDFTFISGGVIVSIAMLKGRPQWSEKFYRFMLPFSITSQALVIIAQVSDCYICKAITSNPNLKDRDVWISAQISSWDLDYLDRQVDDRAALQLNQIKLNSTYSYVRLGMAALFYLRQTLKLKPDTTLSVGLTWVFSVVDVLLYHYRRNGALFSTGEFNSENGHDSGL
jgi:hypothetical protein